METETQKIAEEIPKRTGFFLSHKKSSALVVTIALHALFIVAAVAVVVVKMLPEPKADFEAKTVERPQPKLKRLEVPVKENKKKAPKLREMIVTKPNVAVSLVMPQMVGIKGGAGFENGTGLGSMGLGFDFDPFGGGSGSGNELVGTFYDLKQDPDGDLTDIGEAAAKDSFGRESQMMATDVIDNFISSGCNPRRLNDYFSAPKLKYAKTFMMPPMSADRAPEAYGVQNQVKGSYWICHYKGQIAAPETGRYRFCGIGDDILIVRVRNKVVLDASWPELIGMATSWESDDDDNRRFSMNSYKYRPFSGNTWNSIYEELEKRGALEGDEIFGNVLRSFPEGNSNYMSAACRMAVGDWVQLTKGQRVNIDIIIGEIPGGEFTGRLLIEQQGKEYKMVQSDAGRRPVLPIFKTVEINNQEMIKMMELDPTEMTLDGPVFGALVNSAE